MTSFLGLEHGGWNTTRHRCQPEVDRSIMKVDVGLPGQVHRGLQSCFGEGKTSKAVGVQYMMKTHEHAVSFLGECVCVCFHAIAYYNALGLSYYL